MKKNTGKKLLGLTSALFSAISFGFAPIFAKDVYAAGCNETTLSFWAVLLSVPPLAAIVLCRHGSLRLTKKESPPVLLASVSCCVALFLYNCAAARLPAGSTTALHYLHPALVLLANILLFSYKLTFLRIAAAAVNTAGVLLFFEFEGANSLSGSLLALVSAVCYAVYTLSVDKTELRQTDTFKLSFYISLFSSVFLLIFGEATGALSFHVPRAAWPGIALLAATSYIIGVAFYLIGIARIGSTQTAFASTLEPFTSIVAGILLFHEPWTARVGAGCVLICCGVVLNAMAVSERET